MNLRLCLLLALCPLSAVCLSEGDLFPYGAASGDSRLAADAEDAASPEVALSVNVKFFDREYGAIYVNENGLLSFLTEIPSFFNVQFPLDYPLIAALYTDVDTRAAGTVWYRTTTDPSLLSVASSKVESAFGSVNFNAAELVVATWDGVGYYEERDDKVNTFQIVVASDADSSYAFFLYPEGGIQWIKAQGKNRNMPDAKAQAGIISGDGRHLILPGSGRNQIKQLDKWSNMNQAGMWAFKLGDLGPTGNIRQPNLVLEQIYDPLSAASCSSGGSTLCHSSARCVDGDGSFCCECLPGFLGDGRVCLPADQSQRVSGVISGDVNSVRFDKQDLHSYVVPEDGRVYTALSKVPAAIGTEMQTLSTLSTPIAWLFAKPLSGGSNGFSLTGGRMNYSAMVRFPRTGHSANVDLKFVGLDAFDYLKVEGSVRGTLPPVGNRGTEVTADAFSEEFTRVRPGLITATSLRTMRAVGSGAEFELEVEHRVEYEGCALRDQDAATRVTRLKSARHYINYEGKGQDVLRYISTATVVPLGADEDPCREVTCDEQSYCVVDDSTSTARCQCSPGFESYSLGASAPGRTGCRDVDECARRTHDCSPFADCVNQEASFACRCRPGYVGDGRECLEEVSCEMLSCAENAECVMTRYGAPDCACAEGYQGNGTVCDVVPSDVDIAGESRPATISFDNMADADESSLGSAFSHVYSVSNMGMHTIGGMQVRITWPLKDSSGAFVTYLSRKPYVRYSGPMGDYLDPCDVDDGSLVDPLGIASQDGVRRRRRRRAEAGDYIFDANFTELPNYEDDVLSYEDLSGTDYEVLQEYDQGGYDYSNFDDMYNKETTTSKTAMEEADQTGDGEPQSERVQEEREERRRQEGPGQVQIVCSLNLAGGESAEVTVDAALYPLTLKSSYPTVARVELPSEAEASEGDGREGFARFVGDGIANVVTVANARNVIVGDVPGEGIRCGDATCHRYADCHRSFDGRDAAVCRCVVGYVGDGMQCQYQEQTNEEMDCRQTACSPDATCSFNQDKQMFKCRCNEGFEGDGSYCRRESETCDKVSNCSPYADCLMDQGGTYYCACRRGYQGDGYRCNRVYIDNNSYNNNNGYNNGNNDVSTTTRTPDMCRPDTNDCDAHAKCVTDDSLGAMRCVCDKYYVGDGYRCTPGPDAGCDIKQDCDPDAECVLDPDTFKFSCRCSPGFSGDGKRCRKDVIGCNIINDCGDYAECSFDPAEGGYRCRCQEERGFTGDGFVCRPSSSCFSFPGLCDPNAMCQPGPPGATGADAGKCRCRENYIGDGHTCEAMPVYDGNFLLLGYGMAVMKVPLDATTKAKAGSPISLKSAQTATGLNVDCLKGKVYWTDTTTRLIRRSNYDGSAPEVFLNRDLVFPEGVAVDWLSRNIYWTDPGKRSVEVAAIDDPYGKRLAVVDERVWSPRGIAVDPTSGRLFWSDWDRRQPRIESASLDGSDRLTLVDTMLGMPNSLTLDARGGELCWADAGRKASGARKMVEPKLECLSLRGNVRRPLISLDKMSFPYGIALTESNVFWTDWKRTGVQSALRMGGERQKSLFHALQGIGKPFGLVSVPNECPQGFSACQAGSNRCPSTHLCLPNGSGGANCRCPKDAAEDCRDFQV